MADIIKMPKLSDTMEDGGIAEWLKSEGETVTEGEALVMIETDKATMEYPSPESGVLLKILQPEGSSVDLNVPIAVLGAKDEQFDPKILDSIAAETPQAQETQVAPAAPPSGTSEQQAQTQHNLQSNSNAQDRVIASPLAKKKAAQAGINLHNLQGSGPRGRIIARDLENVSPSQIGQSVASGPEYTDIPVNRMRKTIAQRLLQAKNNAPHFYLTTTIDMTACQNWRQSLNSDEDKTRVSINDLVMFATAKALHQHPQVNSSWQEDSIRQYHSVHLAMAVALPDGLVTPVIRNANHLGIRDMAQSTKAFGKKAKDGGLVPEDYQGGTFTISNLGMTCVDQFTAIINPPQACILAVGRIQIVPVFDEDLNVLPQAQMKVTLSCDHRVVDGMVGAQFLQTLQAYLEDPLSMLE